MRSRRGAVEDFTAAKARKKTEETWEEGKAKAKRGWFGVKRGADKVEDQAVEAKDAALRKAGEAKESVKEGGRRAGNKAQVRSIELSNYFFIFCRSLSHKKKYALRVQEAVESAKSTYRSATDAANRAAHRVEEKVGAAGSTVLAGASAAEEKTGATMKKAGEVLEKDGSAAKKYYRGEQEAKEEEAKAQEKKESSWWGGWW